MPSAIEIRRALDRVTRSDIFRTSDRLNRFLTFVVEARLAEKECPKEAEIARTVYGRLAAYDSRLDPIVRVEAHRLRLKLHEYYATTGADDEIEILIPKGGYRPDFRRRRHGDDSRPASDAAATRLLVLPGATIGRDTWVAPNSVVRLGGFIDDDVIAKGDPAAVVFRRRYASAATPRPERKS